MSNDNYKYPKDSWHCYRTFGAFCIKDVDYARGEIEAYKLFGKGGFTMGNAYRYRVAGLPSFSEGSLVDMNSASLSNPSAIEEVLSHLSTECAIRPKMNVIFGAAMTIIIRELVYDERVYL